MVAAAGWAEGYWGLAADLEVLADSAGMKARVVVRAVQESGWALECAPEELRRDRGVVLAAVRQAGWALRYAPTACL